MPSFQDILNTPATEIKPPEALPIGTYLAIVDGQPELAQRGKNNNNCAIFKLKPIQAQPDVDQQLLMQSLNGSSLQDKVIYHTLWLTDDSKWRCMQFLADHLGIEKGKKTLGEMIPEAMGKQVLVTLSHYTTQDGKRVGHQVKDTAKV